MAPLQPEREEDVPVGAAPGPVPFQRPAQGGHVPSGPGRAAGWHLGPPGPVGTIHHRTWGARPGNYLAARRRPGAMQRLGFRQKLSLTLQFTSSVTLD